MNFLDAAFEVLTGSSLMRRRRMGAWFISLVVFTLLAACGAQPPGVTSAPKAPPILTRQPVTILTPVAPLPSGFPTRPLRLIAPANPGGGWDLTAQELARVINEQRLAPTPVEVYNKPGAGGTVGLAELLNHPGDGHVMLVMGAVMLGNIAASRASVSLRDVTPLARLTIEPAGVAVRAASPYQTIDDLVAAFKRDPGAFKWGGGATGSLDHIAVARLAQAAGVDARAINYRAYAGADLPSVVAGGEVDAGIGGLKQFKASVDAGALRILAVTGDRPLDNPDAPTLQSQGLDVRVSNWRGIVGPTGVMPEERAWLLRLLAAAAASPGWKEALTLGGWDDAFMIEGFDAFLQEQDEAITETLRVIGLAR